MYYIIGGDGKHYGPATLDTIKLWVTAKRISPQTRVRTDTSPEWKTAGEFPELAPLFGSTLARQPGEGAPPVITPPAVSKRDKGLAVLSFVLGLCSFALCLGVLTGIPAIICGHVARRRAARWPARFAGAGLGTAGAVLGYLSIVVSLVIAAKVLPALPKVGHVPRQTNCQHNLRELGLAFKVWALDHNDQYPFNVSTNSGGTRELCAPGPDGFDRNALAHYLIISNELSTPSFLVCPNDSAKHPAANFGSLGQANVTYLLRTGTNINADNPQEILAICPIHGNVLYCDGNVRATGHPLRK